jgi:integrase
VLEAARGRRFEAFVVLALRLGLRRGELLGLCWDDVDFEAKEFTIRRSLTYIQGLGFIVEEPKTESGARTISLLGKELAALRQHWRTQAEERLAVGEAWADSDYVFAAHVGGPMMPRNMLRWWQALTEEAVGRKVRIHAARHTCATLLLEEGVPLEVVSAILGHASLSITMDIYAKVGLDAKRKALGALDRASSDQ